MCGGTLASLCWFLCELSRDCYFGYACCYFGFSKTIIWQGWCSWHPMGAVFAPWDHPGGTCGQQEGYVGVWKRVSTAFGTISESHSILNCFWAAMGNNLFLLSGLFQGHFLYFYWIEIGTPGVLKSGFRKGSTATTNLSREPYFESFVGRCLVFFRSVGSSLPDFCCPRAVFSQGHPLKVGALPLLSACSGKLRTRVLS